MVVCFVSIQYFVIVYLGLKRFVFDVDNSAVWTKIRERGWNNFVSKWHFENIPFHSVGVSWQNGMYNKILEEDCLSSKQILRKFSELCVKCVDLCRSLIQFVRKFFDHDVLKCFFHVNYSWSSFFFSNPHTNWFQLHYGI